MRVQIDAFGAKRLERKFRRLDLDVQRRLMLDALEDGAKPVLLAAKAKAPVETGALKRTIHTARGRNRKRHEVRVQTGTRAMLGIDPTDPWYYPAIVEYGAPTRNISPRSYLRGALDEQRYTATRFVRLRLARDITRVAKR